jgi:hypothetical protein
LRDSDDFENERVCKFNPAGGLFFLKDIFQHPGFNIETAEGVRCQFSADEADRHDRYRPATGGFTNVLVITDFAQERFLVLETPNLAASSKRNSL